MDKVVDKLCKKLEERVYEWRKDAYYFRSNGFCITSSFPPFIDIEFYMYFNFVICAKINHYQCTYKETRSLINAYKKGLVFQDAINNYNTINKLKSWSEDT